MTLVRPLETAAAALYGVLGLVTVQLVFDDSVFSTSGPVQLEERSQLAPCGQYQANSEAASGDGLLMVTTLAVIASQSERPSSNIDGGVVALPKSRPCVAGA